MPGSSRLSTHMIDIPVWRSGVRFAMGAASQLPGKGPTDAACTLIKNPMMIMMIYANILAEKM